MHQSLIQIIKFDAVANVRKTCSQQYLEMEIERLVKCWFQVSRERDRSEGSRTKERIAAQQQWDLVLDGEQMFLSVICRLFSCFVWFLSWIEDCFILDLTYMVVQNVRL